MCIYDIIIKIFVVFSIIIIKSKVTGKEIMKDTSTIKWLYKKSKSQHVKMIFLVLANMFFSVLSVLFAFGVKEVIDGADKQDGNKLLYGAIALGVIVLLQFLFRILINGLTHHIRCKLEIEYKTNTFNEIIKKRYDKITPYHSGELMNRLTNDVNVVSDGVTSIIPAIFSAGTRLLCAIVALIYLDWIFAIAFCVAGIGVFITISTLRGKLKGMHKKAQESDGRVRSFMQECIENLLAIKVFSAKNKIEGKSEELQNSSFKVKMKKEWYSVVGHATYNIIFSAGYLFALIYGGVKIFNGGMGYGALMAILQLVNNVQVPFASLSNVIPKFYAMLASSERLIEIEDIEKEIVACSIDAEQIYSDMKSITVKNLDFGYDREKVLQKANISINKGEFVAIMGESGAGKSTLIKLLLGVYEPTKGRIFIDNGESQTDITAETRPIFTYVPQGNLLFSGTLRENITFAVGRDFSDEQIGKVLEISCCDEFVSQLPEGLDTIVGEKGIGLSEGQLQRIAIARALLSQAPVMLLDEATSALDEKTEKKLLAKLRQLKDKTIIIISHKKAVLNVCDRVIKIDNKTISEEFSA